MTRLELASFRERRTCGVGGSAVLYLRDGPWGTDLVDILAHLWNKTISTAPTQGGSGVAFSYIDVVATGGEHGPEQPVQLSCPNVLARDFNAGRFLVVRTHAYCSAVLIGDLEELAGHWDL